MFIYSKFVFDDLHKHPGRWRNAWTVQDLQQHLPTGIYALFETILERVQAALERSPKHRYLATPFKASLLPVLATMMAPLSIEELSWVTGLGQDEVHYHECCTMRVAGTIRVVPLEVFSYQSGSGSMCLV